MVQNQCINFLSMAKSGINLLLKCAGKPTLHSCGCPPRGAVLVQRGRKGMRRRMLQLTLLSFQEDSCLAEISCQKSFTEMLREGEHDKKSHKEGGR